MAGDLSNKAKVKEAWAAWWKDNADKADLARVEVGPRELKYMLLVEGWSNTGRGGRVLELDPSGKQRWVIENLQYPMGAQVLPGERVLVAEQSRHRVFEAECNGGKIVWEKQVISAFHCQRLKNGNTFVAGRNILVEVDRSGKEIFNRPVNNDTILAAMKLRDGSIAYITYQGLYHRLDSSGKEVKSFRVPYDPNWGINGAEILPNDRVIVTVNQKQQVVEYDSNGKVVWEAKVPYPGNPTRLPSGNTLVAAQSNQWIVELDRNGKEIATYKNFGQVRPWRASRR
jgi:outer membrane protein assembly factor BamB